MSCTQEELNKHELNTSIGAFIFLNSKLISKSKFHSLLHTESYQDSSFPSLIIWTTANGCHHNNRFKIQFPFDCAIQLPNVLLNSKVIETNEGVAIQNANDHTLKIK